MKRKLCAILMVCSMLAQSVCVMAADVDTYTDTAGHWASDSIATWSEQGIVQGSDGAFRPDDNITRGEMAVILNRIMEYQLVSENTFADLDDNFYTDAMLKVNRANIIQGYGDSVRPTDDMTREEAAVVMARVLYLDTEDAQKTDFADDASISTWAKGAVAALADEGILNGKGNNMFDPAASITRAEMVTVLDKAIALLVDEAGEYTEDVDIMVSMSRPLLKNLS